MGLEQKLGNLGIVTTTLQQVVNWSRTRAMWPMLFGLACIGVFYHLKPQVHHFWLGLCYGTIGAALLALWQVQFGGMWRAEGFAHHPITFGDLALAMGLMAICSLNTSPRLRYLPVQLAGAIPLVGPIIGLVNILMIFRGDRRCGHDLIAGTRVVKAK